MKRVVVDRVASRARERKRVQTAETAERPNGLSGNLGNKRAAAAIAHGVGDGLKGGQAIRADGDAACGDERLAANSAGRREEHCGNGVDRIPNDHRIVVNREGTKGRYSDCAGK